MVTTVRLVAALTLLFGERYLADVHMTILLAVVLIASYTYIDCCRARHERRITTQAHRAGKRQGAEAVINAAALLVQDEPANQDQSM